MNQAGKSFIIKNLIFTLIIFGISISLLSTILKPYYFSAFILQILLISVITTIGHLWVIKAAQKNIRRFSTSYMASVTLKLIVYIVYLLISLLLKTYPVFPFVIAFLIYYLSFTIFEVFQILRFIRK